MNKPIKAISLFAGCGGSDLALQQRGYEIVWANDIWDLACKTYADNIRNPKIEEGDIADFDRFPSADLVVGCYPCTGYSQGGRRNAGDPVNYLYRHFDRVLRQVRPKAFIVENVNGMRNSLNRHLFRNQEYRYRLAGYRVESAVLDARDFGVAQSRRRLFIVGVRSDLNEEFSFPKPTRGPGCRWDYASQYEKIGHLPEWPEGEFCSQPLHWYYLSRNRRSTWGKPSACIVGGWRNVPLHPSSPPLRRHDEDDWRFSRPGRARRLSYRECALLQGFPRSWEWNHGKLRSRFELIGNAVPPPLFAAILRPLERLWR